MKIFKILAMLTISLLLFTGCEDDEITNYAFQDVSAPENVTAVFDVSQDDTGTVTVTPSGDGAQVFQVDLGNGESTELAAGESVTTVYDEGEYLVKVVAVGSTGLTSEYNQMLNISFKAPENLMINVDQPANNPKTITVSATADNATVFDVYFGDVDEEEPTQLMPGGSVEHTYEPGVYELTVVARGAGAATAEEDEIIIVPEATDPLKLPITFDVGTVSYAAGTFGGTSYEVVSNPDASGANTSDSNVAAVTNSGANWEGIAYTLGEPVDFSGSAKTISMKVWSDVALPVLLKFEGGVNGERQTEVSANHGGTGWEELTFNFATDAVKSYIDGTQGAGEPFVPTGQYSTMVIFIDGPGTAAGTFYLDDIEQDPGIPFKLPVTFDNFAAYTEGMISPFGGTFEVVANPDTSGDNPAASNVGAFTKDGGQYEGLTFNLDEAIDFSGDNKTMSVTLWSDVEYTVLFKLETGVNGERSNEVRATHTGSGWETLTFDFNNATKSYIDGSQGVGEPFVPTGEYASFSVFFAFEGSAAGTYYIDDIFKVGDDVVSLFSEDFESADNFETSGIGFNLVTNPQQSGINDSDGMVGEVINAGGQYEAVTFTFDEAIDFSAGKTITLKVYSETAYPVLYKLETGVNGERAAEVEVNHGGTGWEELTFDFANNARKSYVDGDPENGQPIVPDGQFDQVSIFLDFAGTTAGTFYIDDMMQN
ncbi:hypothetical protein [Christiangramia aestuarii]|uniref:PKD domain-containing protein n=1 Tax=Christiangramia aestuarii TaxID=1028746 RepID=A0A7K1LSA8_9FLAO|nr:hypothetical protein [Christiangramia aestuarii]MUP43694.1 hypothetical protein [Christiangramia aestuarii]